MLYHIITYGCQMNHSDSERIAAILKLAGLSPTTDIKQAKLLIINSCSVRQSAINRIYGQLINFQRRPGLRKTILTGCLLESDKKKLKDKFDLIIDIKELTNPKNNELKKLLTLINPQASEQEFKAFDYTDYFKINPQYRSNFSAYIPIMTGCNNFCSYCAVPYTRGREISRPATEIITEVEKLIKKGYKEITLLGQNVNSYSSKAPNPKSQIPMKSQNPNPNEISACAKSINIKRDSKIINFPELLKQINDIPGKFWIRFLTSHPKDMSDELIETMAKCEKVCEYIHLPIQAGDDKILEKMNRRYTSAQYLKLIKKIQQVHNLEAELPLGSSASKLKWRPPVAISTDIIVGFPGENKTQFANTAKIMRTVKYDMAYLAQYSPRTGTAAAKLKDNVSIAEKKRRKEFLNDILRRTALANNKKYEGKVVDVLIENPPASLAESRRVGGVNNIMFGKTRTFKNVKISYLETGFPSASGNTVSMLVPGNFARIKITQANAWGLEGEIAKNDK